MRHKKDDDDFHFDLRVYIGHLSGDQCPKYVKDSFLQLSLQKSGLGGFET